MRLLKVRFNNFRRFAGPCSLDLDEALIALVGPNEAGKSSSLDGIEMLLAGQAPADRDVARGSSGPAEVGGLFLLEAEDHSSIDMIEGGADVQRAWVTRSSDDQENPTWDLEPFPHRDRGPREACAKLLDDLHGDPALDPSYSSNQEAPWDPQMPADLIAHLREDVESLEHGVIESLETLAERLRDLAYPPEPADGEDDERDTATRDADQVRQQAREDAATGLVGLAARERQPEPWERIVDLLEDRLPAVAFFREQDRVLTTTYVLAEVVANPPAALVNLCAVAGLNLHELNAEWKTKKPHVEKLIEDANASIKQRFQMTWNQSTVYPRFGPPSDGILRLYISTEGGADYSEVQERSDGLRWFLALDAFLAAQGTHLPVLLVDEAETHLHYDAQADLIDSLMRQDLAAKVIYTTHSIGCLPPDLGRGIRAVLPERNVERSTVENSYWSISPDGQAKVGYTPLLFAMGANLLSLTVPRYGLICEGPSDAILLPTLLREVAGLEVLPYRVVPGLSEIARADMELLSDHAGKVACLSDGDPAGQELGKQVEDAGAIDASCIFNLSSVAPGCTLEDLVDADVFAHAVNMELETWGVTAARLTSADVPDTARWAALKTWCDAHDGRAESLNKNRVAQRVVDLRSSGEDGTTPRSVVAESVAEELRALHGQVASALGTSVLESA